jgi:hypothetical protein
MARFTYYVRDSREPYFVDSECRHLKDIAGDAARDFHYNHDGWEARWPIDFTVVGQNGVEQRFSIERDMEPVFFATSVPGKEVKP